MNRSLTPLDVKLGCKCQKNKSLHEKAHLLSRSVGHARLKRRVRFRLDVYPLIDPTRLGIGYDG